MSFKITAKVEDKYANTNEAYTELELEREIKKRFNGYGIGNY